MIKSKIHVIIFSLLLWVCTPQLALGEDIAVVPSSAAEPYRIAQEGLTSVLSKADHSISVLSLEEIQDDPGRALLGFDVVVAIGSKAAVKLADLSLDHTLVYCMVSNPGILELCDKPAINGICTNIPIATQLSIISKALPDTRTVGLLYRSGDGNGEGLLEDVKATLPPKWRMEAVAIDDHSSVAKAIEALLDCNIDIAWTVPDPKVYDMATVRALLLGALRRKIPVFGFSSAFVRAGAMLGVGINPHDQGVQAGEMVTRILSNGENEFQSSDQADGNCGEKPQHMIAVNLITMERLGVKVAEEIITDAELVFRPRAPNGDDN